MSDAPGAASSFPAGAEPAPAGAEPALGAFPLHILMPEPDEAWDEALLKKWIRADPGLAGGWAEDLLTNCGIYTVDILAGITDSAWADTLSFIPQKRITHPEDLRDNNRKGPGHLNSLDELRKKAKAHVARRGSAQAK